MKVYLLLIEDPWDEYYDEKPQGIFTTKEAAERGYNTYMGTSPHSQLSHSIEEYIVQT